jgi:C-terminal processing protease CtpA/Prc
MTPGNRSWASILVAAGLALLLAAAALTYSYRDTLGLADPPKNEQIENLRAFAKLYGYVRYFHPSDAAANTDWDMFAIHGVRQVRNAASRAELQTELQALFKPIAPTVQLYRTGREPPPLADVLTPADPAGLRTVAWQHRGLGLHGDWPYYSTRLHRPVGSSPRNEGDGDGGEDRLYARAFKSLDVEQFQGTQIRLRAAVRTASAEDQAHLYISSSTGLEGSAGDPISSEAWSTAERTVSLPLGVNWLSIGASVRDSGTAWVDDVELSTRDGPKDTWEPVRLDNASFESGQPGRPPPGWDLPNNPGTWETIVAGTGWDGEQSLKLSVPSPSDLQLFDEHPRPGEAVEKPLGRGLSVQMPLALYSRDGQTVRPDEAPSPSALQARLDALEIQRSGPDFFVANVVAAWNAIQHFYPYFDAVDVDWDQVLTRSLRRALADKSEQAFQRTLQRLVARLQDGHGRIRPSPATTFNFPFRLDRADGQVVVAATTSRAGVDENVCPETGDVVVSVGGTPIEAKLREAKRYISGSPQYEDVEALEHFESYVDRDTDSLTLRRDGSRVECKIHPRSSVPSMQTEPRPDPIAELDGGVYYVDLTRAPWSRVRGTMNRLAQARGVVFDMRGYPENGNGGSVQVVQHLAQDTVRAAPAQTPQLIYPDQDSLIGYDSYRFTLAPNTPTIDGPVVFLTDARAISAAERLMGIVKHYDLATIVGQPTAGASGAINPTDLIGNSQVTWTGQRLRKHDGSQHHLVGIQPDVLVERTIEGVKDGRDEILQKALRLLTDSHSTMGPRSTHETRP